MLSKVMNDETTWFQTASNSLDKSILLCLDIQNIHGATWYDVYLQTHYVP